MIADRVRQLAGIRWPILLMAAAICAIGIYNLESATRKTMPGLYTTQLWWVLFGLAVALSLAAIDYRFSRRVAYAIYVKTNLLLVLVLLVGHTVKGSTRWLQLGPLNIQPSEIMKVSIILLLARYLSAREVKEPYTIRSLIRPFNISRPLLLGVLVLWKWRSPVLASPLGQLAGWLSAEYNGVPPVIQEGMWFRIGMLILTLAAFGVLIWWQLTRASQTDLLSSEKPGAPMLLLVLASLLLVGMLGAITWLWNEPFFMDPFNTMIRALINETAPGGRYAVSGAAAGGYGLRVLLLLLAGMHLAVSFLVLRYRGWRGRDDLIAPLDYLVIPALLIIIEPDLGTTLILLAIAGTMFLYVGIRRWSLAIIVLTMVLGSGVAWAGFLEDYQKRRIITFLDPEQDARGAGYHSIQSLIAVGSGQVWGKGHGKGTQTQLRFLPEQHTDFAFSVWAEEMGFVGCGVVLLLYLLLLLQLLFTAARAPDEYGSLVVVGTAAMIFWHMLVNVGMVLGMLPVVGVPLPLFSYGGSSVVTIMTALGLALSISMPVRTFTTRL